MDKMPDQYVYYTLYTLLTYHKVPPAVYLREFQETSNIDGGNNFKKMRDDVETTCTPATMEKILNFQELSKSDESKAEYTVVYYRELHKEKLWDALSPDNKLYYMVFDAIKTLFYNINRRY